LRFSGGRTSNRAGQGRRLLFASYLAPSVRGLYQFVADACGRSRLVEGGDWRELATSRIDVAFVCSPPLIWLRGAVEAIAAPVLSDPRFRGEPLHCSEVVVGRNTRYQSLRDLRGARWAFNEPSSWSGYWVTLARVGDWRYFGQVVAAGSHMCALQMVAGGQVDGAAIDCHVLAVALRDRPELADQVRIVESLGPAPIQPVVVRADLDPELKLGLQARLLSLGDEILSRFFVKRFAPAPDYSAVMAVVAPAAQPVRLGLGRVPERRARAFPHVSVA
jgi:phosphonate transport system substrate-binding protein